MYTTDLKLLETKGFVVIPKFLSFDEVQELLESYQTVKKQSIFQNKNPGYKLLSGDPSLTLKNKALTLLDAITKSTNIKVDLFQTQLTYIDTDLVKFNVWHQDHDCFYQTQDLYNFVNFWIPIKKPDINDLNLELIPHNELQDRVPDFFTSMVLGQGQLTFYPSRSFTIVENHATHQKTFLNFNLDQLRETPCVNAGDLVLYRGDVIHRTENSLNGHRVALNLRAVYSNTVVYKDKFLQGGIFKQQFIDNYPNGYAGIKEKFDQVDQFLLSELYNT